MKRFKAFFTLFAALATALGCLAQTVWYNPVECGAQIHGQGWPELNGSYFRLPDHAEDKVNGGVWGLSRCSAGLSVVFRSNADTLCIRYKVSEGLSMYHMPSTGVSGVDMYALGPDGQLRWCFPDFPARFREEEIICRYSGISYHPDGNASYEYHVYLPTYNIVEKLEIGVGEGDILEFVPASKARPIVAYGTSIAQGACSSRPGNAWTNILERELRQPFVNLGFSGSGKLEPEMFELLSEIDAKMYIIDCIPNMIEMPERIVERIIAGVGILRKNHDCPILLVEHSGCGSDVTDSLSDAREAADDELEKAFGQLTAEGVQGVYLMTREDISMPMDGMVEGNHPNDYGMRVLADAFEKAIYSILY